MKKTLDEIQLRRLDAFGYKLSEPTMAGLIEVLPETIKLNPADEDSLSLTLTIQVSDSGTTEWLACYSNVCLESDGFIKPELIDALYHLAIIAKVKNYIPADAL